MTHSSTSAAIRCSAMRLVARIRAELDAELARPDSLR